MYFQNTYSPTQNAQQRLMQYEQMQQQFQQQLPMQQAPMQQQFQQPVQQVPQTLKGRAVTGIDEARSAMIDFDGSVNVFLDIANGKIYTKQINLDGTATLNTYKIDDTPSNNPIENTNSNYVSKEEFDQLKAKIDQYETIFNDLMGGAKNE